MSKASDSQSNIRYCIEQYFTQLTRGCKDANLSSHSIYCCHNPACTKIIDPNLAAVKAIEYAKVYQEKFLCASLSGVTAVINKCKESDNYSNIIKLIKDSFSLPSEIASLFLVSSEDKKRVNKNDYNYFQGIDLIEARKVFKSLQDLGRNDVLLSLIEASTNLSASVKYNASTYKDPDELRSIVILFQNPLIYELEYSMVLTNLFHAIRRLKEVELKKEEDSKKKGIPLLGPILTLILQEWISTFSKEHFIQYLTNTQQFISVRLMTADNISLNDDLPIMGACQMLSLLYKNNEKFKYVPYTEFYNDLINLNLDLSTDYLNWKGKGFTFTSCPFILNTSTKSTYLQIDHRLVQNQFRAIVPGFEYVVLKVHREHIIHDTLNFIQKYKKKEYLRRELKIQFIGEDGVDQGGVQKEFFQIVVRRIFDSEFGMFKYNESTRTWWFNINSTDLLEFELIGIILGLALYNTTILDVHFPIAVYKKLLNIPIGLEDVESIDPMIYQSLIKLREATDDVSNWMTYFSVEVDYYGQTKIIELKPGGNDILVDNNNREEYIQLYTHYLLESSISSQWEHFKKGFTLVCDTPFLPFIRAEELEDLICGVEDLDFNELEKNTIYEGGYTKDDTTIIYFWQVIHSLTNDLKKKFLSFTTGSDRVPYGGLSKLQFSITKQPDSDRLPSAHTCFNALILPSYPTKEKLEGLLLKAIQNSEGFGLR